jgi:DNA helicase II / ATP-dependent DNA helicase PcrA
MAEFELSPQQLAVVQWVRDGQGNGYVEAVAGSGKTKALLACCEAIREPVQFAAFNRKIADEISGRAQSMGLQHVQVGTFHSFGLAAWKRLHRDVRAGPDAALAKRGEAFNMAHTPAGQRAALAKLVSFCKQSALLPAGVSPDACRDLIERFGLEAEFPQSQMPGALEDISAATSRLLHAHITLSDAYLDFDDMIYMPVVEPGCAIRTTPWVLVDEAQDTNAARRELAKRMVTRGTGRMLWVGDSRQAIYGFSGADADAVEQIKDGLLCCEMPLTVTYRCPRSIVERARAIVPGITAANTAPEGVVREIEADKDGVYFTLRERLKPADAILCRNTAPLVRTALRILQQGMACQVEGRDIGR